jgi:hypothetical protein
MLFVVSLRFDFYLHDAASSDLSRRKPVSIFASHAALVWNRAVLDPAGQVW